jgi:anti-sigma28 factor (negative regulator of flagellin synthesis)
MHVNKVTPATTAEALQRAQQIPASQAPVDPVAPSRGADAVQLSDAGLAMASKGAQQDPVTTLDPQRADSIRASILSGAYNSLEMADQVARAVIRSGDL